MRHARLACAGDRDVGAAPIVLVRVDVGGSREGAAGQMRVEQPFRFRSVELSRRRAAVYDEPTRALAGARPLGAIAGGTRVEVAGGA